MPEILLKFWEYLEEVLPALGVGFLLSGIINEYIREEWIKRHLGHSGIQPILAATLVGIILPVCCWGALPIVVSFHRKGARLGPVLAFLVATPATSISAILVCLKLLGMGFTIFLCLSVIALGLFIGILGNLLLGIHETNPSQSCPSCAIEETKILGHEGKTPRKRIFSILRFAFLKMPKEIGLEILLALTLAALIAGIHPIGNLIKQHLEGLLAYPFALLSGFLMYICSTASVPLVHAFLAQGMNPGAGMVMLIAGPITSYGTIFVLRRHFGLKILSIYLSTIFFGALLCGILFYQFT